MDNGARQDSESILQEAERLTSVTRRGDYGHPLDDFTRTGRMWAAILGQQEVTAEQVGLCMAALKISRQCNLPKRDNLVDAAGYVRTVDMVIQEREQRLSAASRLSEMERHHQPSCTWVVSEGALLCNCSVPLGNQDPAQR